MRGPRLDTDEMMMLCCCNRISAIAVGIFSSELERGTYRVYDEEQYNTDQHIQTILSLLVARVYRREHRKEDRYRGYDTLTFVCVYSSITLTFMVQVRYTAAKNIWILKTSGADAAVSAHNIVLFFCRRSCSTYTHLRRAAPNARHCPAVAW